jgi:hypothetical protein
MTLVRPEKLHEAGQIRWWRTNHEALAIPAGLIEGYHGHTVALACSSLDTRTDRND